MANTRMKQLAEYGQSIWLDYISRPLLDTGKLKEFITNGLRGMTSNPSIFNSAIGSTTDYDNEIIRLKKEGKSTFEIYDALTVKDIQDAADQFRDVYKQTHGLDGYVSLEINPLLAHKVKEQAAEGKRLFGKVSRPNVMIKVPSTPEGFPVIRDLIAHGINVNVTLIFSLEQYENTVKAYLGGLSDLAQTRDDLSHIRSVASVFVSRVDTLIDKLLEERFAGQENETKLKQLQNLRGKAAVANCRVIFERYKQLFSSEEFKKLENKGAHVQRVLWGSTSTKNPAYKDVKYIEELIAKPTVNTVPEKTLNAFLDHGKVEEAFRGSADESKQVLSKLKDFGIDIDDICAQLLSEGCVAFDKAFEDLLGSLERKAEELCHS